MMYTHDMVMKYDFSDESKSSVLGVGVCVWGGGVPHLHNENWKHHIYMKLSIN